MFSLVSACTLFPSIIMCHSSAVPFMERVNFLHCDHIDGLLLTQCSAARQHTHN